MIVSYQSFVDSIDGRKNFFKTDSYDLKFFARVLPKTISNNNAPIPIFRYSWNFCYTVMKINQPDFVFLHNLKRQNRQFLFKTKHI